MNKRSHPFLSFTAALFVNILSPYSRGTQSVTGNAQLTSCVVKKEGEESDGLLSDWAQLESGAQRLKRGVDLEYPMPRGILPSPFAHPAKTHKDTRLHRRTHCESSAWIARYKSRRKVP